MATYQENHYYSPLHDSDVVRFSMFNAQHQEYFATVPVDEGRAWRETKEVMLDALAAAVRADRGPGEVKLTADEVTERRHALLLKHAARVIQ